MLWRRRRRRRLRNSRLLVFVNDERVYIISMDECDVRSKMADSGKPEL
jgi:hypothetical protein